MIEDKDNEDNESEDNEGVWETKRFITCSKHCCCSGYYYFDYVAIGIQVAIFWFIICNWGMNSSIYNT